MKNCWFALTLLLSPFFSPAQNITGIWRGHFRSSGFYQRSGDEDDRYRMEVQVAQTVKDIQAVTYSYKSQDFYGKADADGSVNQKSGKVVLRELRITEVRMTGGVACTMTCSMQYSKLGDEEFLQGTYTSMNTTDSTGCGKGTIFLHKVTTSDFSKEPFVDKRERELALEKRAEKKKGAEKKINPPVAVNRTPARTKISPAAKPKIKKPVPPSVASREAPHRPVTSERATSATENDTAVAISRPKAPTIVPRVIASRANAVISSITVTSADIALSIYDDGEVDNDTVSVFYDNRLILSHARLTTQAINLTIHVEPGETVHELTMVAENLGEIPPNTSLMVVRDGEKRQDVRITTTEQKNAVIHFVRKN